MVALIIIYGNFYTLLASLFLPLDSLLLALVYKASQIIFVFSIPLSVWQTWPWPFHLVQEERAV